MLEFFKNLFSFRITKNRIIVAILLIIFLSILALIASTIYRFEKPQLVKEDFMTRLENSESIENKEVIKIEEYDLDDDKIHDYISIVGNPVTSEASTDTIEAYSDLKVIFISGSTNEVIEYNTKKKFSASVELYIYKDNNNKYVFVKDETAGNVVVLMLKDNKFEDLIKNSFGNTFNGYTINTKINKNNVKVTLDNYGISYLPTDDNTYTLDFKDKGIDIEKYRETYNLNTFSAFDLIDTDNDGTFELITKQYILYLYKDGEGLEKNLGNVIITFKNTKGKYKFNKIDVEL